MACMVDVWVEKRGVDRQVVVVVGVHGGFVGGEARCRPPSGGLGGFVGGDASIAIMTGDPHRHGSGTATSSRAQLQRRSKLMERPLARGKPC